MFWRGLEYKQPVWLVSFLHWMCLITNHCMFLLYICGYVKNLAWVLTQGHLTTDERAVIMFLELSVTEQYVVFEWKAVAEGWSEYKTAWCDCVIMWEGVCDEQNVTDLTDWRWERRAFWCILNINACFMRRILNIIVLWLCIMAFCSVEVSAFSSVQPEYPEYLWVKLLPKLCTAWKSVNH